MLSQGQITDSYPMVFGNSTISLHEHFQEIKDEGPRAVSRHQLAVTRPKIGIGCRHVYTVGRQRKWDCDNEFSRLDGV